MITQMGYLVEDIVAYSKHNLITALNPSVQLTSPLISFKQGKLAIDSAINLKARDETYAPYVKVSEAVMVGQELSDVYFFEMLEYGFNVHDLNHRYLATNPVEIRFYDESDLDTVVPLVDTQKYLEIAFPLRENYNLTALIDEYKEFPYNTEAG